MSKPGTSGSDRPPYRRLTQTDRTQPAHRAIRFHSIESTTCTVRTSEGSRR